MTPQGTTSSVLRARVRNRSRVVMHRVPVLHSAVEAHEPALCGFLPKPSGLPWVLDPAWPDKDCALCVELEAKL